MFFPQKNVFSDRETVTEIQTKNNNASTQVSTLQCIVKAFSVSVLQFLNNFLKETGNYDSFNLFLVQRQNMSFETNFLCSC